MQRTSGVRAGPEAVHVVWTLRGSSGQAGRRAAEGAGVVVLSCGRLREAGGRAWGVEVVAGYGSVCFQLCTIYRREVGWKLEGGLRGASEF